MTDFDKLFDELFGEDLEAIDAELDKLDAEMGVDEEDEEESSPGALAVEVEPGADEASDNAEPEDPNLAELRKARAARPELNQVKAETRSEAAFYDADDDDEDFYEDTEVGGEFDSSCPYCGESVSIFLDPAGGSVQDFVEDCAVCCQPMAIRVRFSGDGHADVTVDTA